MSSGWSDLAPKSDGSEVHWDPESERIDTDSLEGMDAVVHLAGENIGSGRWTRDKKARIFDSRVKGTRLLCESLANLVQPSTAGTGVRIGYRLLRQPRRQKTMNEESSTSGFRFLSRRVQRVGNRHRVHRSRDGNPSRKSQNWCIVLSTGGGTVAKDAAALQNGSWGDIGQRTAVYELDQHWMTRSVLSIMHWSRIVCKAR